MHATCLILHSQQSPSPSFLAVLFPCQMQKPRVTEIHVRMDCNGCVQKIKKAVDFQQQKLTVIGWADPERIVKAIRKTRKIATICSHTEQPDPAAQPTEPQPEQGALPSQPPAPDAVNPPPPEAAPAEAGPPPETPQPLPPENPPVPEVSPSPIANDTNPEQTGNPVPGPRDVQQAYVTYHYQPDYGYRFSNSQGYGGYWNRYPGGPGFSREPAPAPGATPNHSIPSPSPVYVSRYPGGPGFPQEPAPAPAPAAPAPNHSIPSPSPIYVAQSRYPGGPGFPQEPAPAPAPTHSIPSPSPIYVTQSRYPPEPAQAPVNLSPNPMYVTHSYNTYRPSTYVTEYEYIRSPCPIQQPYYSSNDHYSEEYRMNSSSSSSSSNGNGNVISMFSDENPNACTIV